MGTKMDTNGLCEIGAVFAENEKYVISRYAQEDAELYYQMLDEIYRDSTITYVESVMDMQWKMTLNNSNLCNFKVIQKDTGIYIGDLSIMQLDTRTPEIGIHLLEAFRNQGMGYKVMKLYIEKLKQVLNADYLFLRIKENNYASYKVLSKLGAIQISREEDGYAKVMKQMMEKLGEEKFEEITGKTYEELCPVIKYYKIEI